MSRTSARHGFILHEAMMAVGLAMALSVAAAQLLVLVAQQRRMARQYAAATREAGNLMENLLGRSWDDTTTEALASTQFSDEGRAQLPEASLSVDVADEDERVKRITLQIGWESGAGRAVESVRLVGWRFLAGEDRP